MKKFFLSVALLAGISVAATAQTSKSTSVQGTNPNPDAPVNVSDPSLRPAQPAMYSSSSLPENQKGQFYVKDDKPATPDGRVITIPTTPPPSKAEMQKQTPAAATAPAANSGSKGSKPAARKASK